jgi:hypothetical protein
MMNLIDQAIDSSILTFKNKINEQSGANNEVERPELSARPTLAAATAPLPGPERPVNPLQRDPPNSNHTPPPTGYDSLDPISNIRQNSSRLTIGSDLNTQEFTRSDITADGRVSVDCQNEGDHLEGFNGNDEATASISASAKGKQKEIYPQYDGNYDEDFPADQGLQQEYLDPSFANQDDHFGHTALQQDMTPNFDDFFLDSGWGSDWN